MYWIFRLAFTRQELINTWLNWLRWLSSERCAIHSIECEENRNEKQKKKTETEKKHINYNISAENNSTHAVQLVITSIKQYRVACKQQYP